MRHFTSFIVLFFLSLFFVKSTYATICIPKVFTGKIVVASLTDYEAMCDKRSAKLLFSKDKNVLGNMPNTFEVEIYNYTKEFDQFCANYPLNKGKIISADGDIYHEFEIGKKYILKLSEYSSGRGYYFDFCHGETIFDISSTQDKTINKVRFDTIKSNVVLGLIAPSIVLYPVLTDLGFSKSFVELATVIIYILYYPLIIVIGILLIRFLYKFIKLFFNKNKK